MSGTSKGGRPPTPPPVHRNRTLSEVIKGLQALEAEGHGDLLVCTYDDDGWYAMSTKDALAAVHDDEYNDIQSTRWSYQRGPFVAIY